MSGVSRVSKVRTAHAIQCPEHGQVFLTDAEYIRQMSLPDSLWICPICAEYATWDDDNYDAFYAECEKQESER